MKIQVTTKLGGVDYTFEIEESKEMETLHKAIVLANPPKYCHVCGNSDENSFMLASNKDGDGNIYVNNVCTNDGCFAKAKLGQYKTGGYFWKNFEKYQKSE